MVRQSIETPIPGNFTFYHHGKKVKRDRSIKQEERMFIAWDGEGINLRGPGKPQSYVLFGSSVDHIASKFGLSTFDCLDHIIETGKRHVSAIHIGFAFGYDSNMIVASLSPSALARLHRDGWVRLKRQDGSRYTITFAKGKFFRVTKYAENYHHKRNSTAKVTVQIFDIFSFFMCSFIKAYEQMVGQVPDAITEGKANRREFSLNDWNEILHYWSIEIQLLRELAEELRRRVFNAGLKIRQWHGPGALASYAMTGHSIRTHMAESPPEVREAARYAYAGGRFELFKVGRVLGPVYGVDINSAYPHAISQLPSLKDGYWRFVSAPTEVKRFGVYHVRLRRFGGLVKVPSPLFHRDKNHNISFPWFTEGWYWSPEAHLTMKHGAEIIEGWEFVGGRERPFAWITDMYEQRKDWKRRGISAQLALKLCMNSMYGKLAQRVGWTETNQRIPPFHQLEWAGWVTSYVRARLFQVMLGIPFDKLIAVETDGIYTTVEPSTLGITDSGELGGWEVSTYAELLYVQSGLAWLRHTNDCRCGKCVGSWEGKRRGLDPCIRGHLPEECDCPGTFSLQAARRYLTSLHARPDKGSPWPDYEGETTRFIGLGQALARRPVLQDHCVWVTDKRVVSPGSTGKRVHVGVGCAACDSGASGYEQAHDLVIQSLSTVELRSYPHSIPWETEEGHSAWRDYTELQDNDVTLQYV